jgi:hypothetical protein
LHGLAQLVAHARQIRFRAIEHREPPAPARHRGKRVDHMAKVNLYERAFVA